MPSKKIFTQEMIDDLYKIGDTEFCRKWNITKPTIRKYRYANNIKSFVPMCGTKPHKFENGIEYKWCYVGHWEPITNFFRDRKNYDGVVRCCKFHVIQQHRERNERKKKETGWVPKGNWIKHKIENGIEYKRCPIGPHWVVLDGFYKNSRRHDGLSGVCIQHSKEMVRGYNKTEKYINAKRAWRNSPNGKECQRRTWRKQKEIKNNAMVSWNKEDEHFAYDLFNHQCAYCGFPIEFLTLEFDHFVPIKLGGKTQPDNMIPCCHVCNHGDGGKFAKDALQWMTEKFGERAAILIYKDIKKKLSMVRKVEDQHLMSIEREEERGK